MSRVLLALGTALVLASCVRIVWRNTQHPEAVFERDLAQCRADAGDANEGTQRVSMGKVDITNLMVKTCMQIKGWEKKNEFE